MTADFFDPIQRYHSSEKQQNKKKLVDIIPQRKRCFKIPEKGIDKELLVEEVEKAVERCAVRYDKGIMDAKPGTLPDQFSYSLAASVVGRIHPNLVDPAMFVGMFELERETMSMLGELMHHPNIRRCNAWFTSGGSESMTQALYSFRNKYFREKEGFSFANNNKHDKPKIRASGLQSFLGDKPKILVPVDAHLCVERAADVLGLGIDSVVHYGLDNKYQTDLKSFRERIDEIHKQGDNILAVIPTVGDVSKGRLDKVSEMFEILKEKYGGKNTPPIIVDAAQQFLFSSVIGEKSIHQEWDFGIEGVKAIILDPHKTPGAVYGGGVVMFRDTELMNETSLESPYLHSDKSQGYEFVEEMGQLPGMFISRSGHNAVMLWAYLTSRGMSGLRKEAERMQGLTKKLSQALESPESPFKLITGSACPIIPFEMKEGGHKANDRVYHRINESGDEERYYISHSDTMKVRTLEDLAAYKESKRKVGLNEKAEGFGGLYVQIMNHHTDERVNGLIKHLYHVGRMVARDV
ncbi:MAG: pyridoxal-dependent decarboxylase [Nanoarchaeota archaeon]